MDGIISKERVQKHGEVFTPDSIVNDMLDLVDKNLNKEELAKSKQELTEFVNNITKYVCTTYLEPSCGNGNFLIRILDRKLQVLQLLPETYWEAGLVKAVASIYGVDIQSDNVRQSRERMLELIENGSVDVLELSGKEKEEFHFTKYELSDSLRDVLTFVLENNIKHGDCLTGKAWESDGVTTAADKETNADMIFFEYIWYGDMITYKGHTLEDIKSDSNNDVFNNNNRTVHYTEMKSLNHEYSDTFAEDEEF